MNQAKSELSPVSMVAVNLALQHSEPGVVILGEPIEEISESLVSAIAPHLRPNTIAIRFCPLEEIPYPDLKAHAQQCDFYRFRIIAFAGKAMVVNVDHLESLTHA